MEQHLAIDDLPLEPLYVADNESYAGLSEEHWHVAYTVFHALGQHRNWRPYPVTMKEGPVRQSSSTPSAIMHTAYEQTVHFEHDNVRIQVTDSVKFQNGRAAYCAKVEEQNRLHGDRWIEHGDVVIKVNPILNTKYITPQPPSSRPPEGFYGNPKIDYQNPAILGDNTKWLDSAVLEPVAMVTLQKRWEDMQMATHYPGAKLLCSFLVQCPPDEADKNEEPEVFYDQVTVLAYNPGTDPVSALTEENSSPYLYLECFRQTAEFIWDARDLGVDVMNQRDDCRVFEMVSDDEVQVTHVDFKVCRVHAHGPDMLTLAPCPWQIPDICLDPNPIRCFRNEWAKARNSRMLYFEVPPSFTQGELMAPGVAIRRNPRLWLFESLVERAGLRRKLAIAYQSLEVKFFHPALLQAVPGIDKFYKRHETAYSLMVAENETSNFEPKFQPLDYTFETARLYGDQFAAHMIRRDMEEAIRVVQREVSASASQRSNTLLPYLLFAKFADARVHPGDVGYPKTYPSLSTLQQWVAKCPRIAGLVQTRLHSDVMMDYTLQQLSNGNPETRRNISQAICSVIEPWLEFEDEAVNQYEVHTFWDLHYTLKYMQPKTTVA